MKLRRGLGVLLVGVLVLSVAPRVGAQQIPTGCTGTGLTINLFEKQANGGDKQAGSAVFPCETLRYVGSLTGGSQGVCCFQGGTVTITTPRTCASNADCTDNPNGSCGTEIAGRCSYDVTPVGGVPQKCPGDGPTATLTVQYQVRQQDILPPSATCTDPDGCIRAQIDFTAAESFTGTPPSMGVPIGSTAVPNTISPCPPSTPCRTSFCDPTLQGTGADTGRTGVCTTTPVTDSTPCSADNAGNPVTAIPGSCKTPGCEAGECVRAHIPITDSTPCSADNAGNPVTAIPGACKTPGCEAGECVTQHIAVTDSTACSVDNAGNPVTAIPGSCKTPGCEAGQCVQAHINVTDSTPCTDTDHNACTRAGCEAGSCVQTHVVRGRCRR